MLETGLIEKKRIKKQVFLSLKSGYMIFVHFSALLIIIIIIIIKNMTVIPIVISVLGTYHEDKEKRLEEMETRDKSMIIQTTALL